MPLSQTGCTDQSGNFPCCCFFYLKRETSFLAKSLLSSCLTVAASLAPHPLSQLSGQKVVEAGGVTTALRGRPAAREVSVLVVVGLGARRPGGSVGHREYVTAGKMDGGKLRVSKA